MSPDGLGDPGLELWNHTRLLWILDGLDEVVDAAARQTVAGWIREAIKDRPHDWFVVTCRFAGYFRDGVPLGAKFAEFHVRPLDDGQIATFIQDWFRAAYRKLYQPQSQADETSKKLLDILELPQFQAGHIRELATNPLLLTILCIVFHEERQLPTGRAELYSHCIRVLLQRWRREVYELAGEQLGYDADAAEAVLARVAWWMHQEQDRTTAPLAELAAEAEKGLAVVSASSNLQGDGHAFLSRMRDEAGILAMSGDGDGSCGFLHLSFQEYLAAQFAASEGRAKELALHAPESWWREVALLSLRHSRPFCEEFFKQMLAAGIAEQHPDLADRLLTESLYFAAEPFVAALKNTRSSPARQAAVLRLLKDNAARVPDLEQLCRGFANSRHADVRGFANEILAQLGAKLPARDGGLSVDDKTGITFVTIPAGVFPMGGTQHGDEKPIHQVEISREFWLAKYPVTNAQYQRYLESAGGRVKKPSHWDDRRFNQPDQPVVGVSWQDAQAYCKWAGCRLPTEAEWEYACRAGTTTEFSFGDNAELLVEYGWFGKNSNGQSQPVGAKKPNAWGLHDMHGNVWEWCQDWFEEYAAGAVRDPMGPERGLIRVIRGGSWNDPAEFCRSAYRCWNDPVIRDDDLGFRVARSPSGRSGP